MAYLEESEDILHDIYSRKEFFRYKPDDDKKDGPFDNLKPMIDIDKYERNILKERSYQLLPSTFIGPHTPYRTGYVKYGTGIGKTITSLRVAMSMIDMYQKSGQTDRTVFVIGFSKKIYQSELLSHPEFGFASEAEIKEYRKLQHLAIHGTDREKHLLSEMKIRLYKRLSNKRLGGYYKFFGYREFANHLFVVSEDFDIYKADETEIKQAIVDGVVKINKDLLSQFEHGVMICDEIHNTYNSLEKNNWGMAIQTVLDHVPTLRALFLSATPFNASQTEVIDLANMLSPKKLSRTEIFTEAGELKKGADDLIRDAMRGRVFFMHDSDNSDDYPEVIWTGQRIPGIDYLRFIRCKLSPQHVATYKKEFADRGQADEESQTLMQDKQYLLDFSLPNPDSKSKFGIYRTAEVLTKLRSASDDWKKKNKIRLVDKIVMGDILKIGNLGKIAAKAERMMKDVIRAIKTKRGKQFIYHSVVFMSGIKFLANVLLMNGFLDLTSAPNNDTLCVKCGQEYKKCNKRDPNCFRPARYILIHSDNSRAYNEQLMSKFNSRNNLKGHDVFVLLGSKAVEEMYSFKAVRNLRVMSRPDNISNLIQIIGRVNRKGMHKDLPPADRNVEVAVYTAQVPGALSYEEQKYKEKVADYRVIQQLEKILHEVAIDSAINRDIVGDLPSKPRLGILDYKPEIRKPPRKLKLSTFRAFYQSEEVDQIVYVIKRAFIQYSPVWKYDHLLRFVMKPPFKTVTNMSIIDEDSFIVALKRLLWDTSKVIVHHRMSLVNALQDPASKILETETGSAVIVTSGEFLKMVPFEETPIVSEDSHYRIFQPNSAFHHLKPVLLSVSEYLKEQQDDPDVYYQKKLKFFSMFQETKIEKMERVLHEFQYEFHLKFLEETIQYVFRILTHVKEKRSEFHDFYFKMLYYYSMLDLVIFANTTTPEMVQQYREFLSGKLKKKIVKNKVIDVDQIEEFEDPITDDEIKTMSENFMLENLKNSRGSSQDFSLKIESAVAYSNSKSTESRKQTAMSKKSNYGKEKTIRVKPSLLPIGHFLDKTARFYHPAKDWYDIVNYHENKNNNWQENKIIIGFFDKITNSTKLLFKLRSPQTAKDRVKSDLRLVEKGSVCTTKSKEFLIDVAKKLGIVLEKKSTTKLCDAIRVELLAREYEERRKKSKNKWFYYHWEI